MPFQRPPANEKAVCGPVMALNSGRASTLELHRTAGIQAPPPSAPRCDLKQAARDRNVLQEMNHLVLVAEVVMKKNRGRQSENREHRGRQARLQTD